MCAFFVCCEARERSAKTFNPAVACCEEKIYSGSGLEKQPSFSSIMRASLFLVRFLRRPFSAASVASIIYLYPGVFKWDFNFFAEFSKKREKTRVETHKTYFSPFLTHFF